MFMAGEMLWKKNFVCMCRHESDASGSWRGIKARENPHCPCNVTANLKRKINHSNLKSFQINFYLRKITILLKARYHQTQHDI